MSFYNIVFSYPIFLFFLTAIPFLVTYKISALFDCTYAHVEFLLDLEFDVADRRRIRLKVDFDVCIRCVRWILTNLTSILTFC